MSKYTAIIFCTAMFLTISSPFAGTAVEYKTDCTYIDAKNVVRFKGRCDANFGIAGVDGRGSRYILTLTNKNSVEIWVYNYHNLALVNGVAARISMSKNSARILVVTGENEQFIFGDAPQGTGR